MLLGLTLCSALLFQGICIAEATPANRIVGGSDVEISAYPYQLSLQYYDKHICGATIISKTFALTAANCVYCKCDKGFSVRSGSSYVETGGIVTDVSKVVTHPKFNETSLDYDVAALHLSFAIELSNQAQPIGIIPKGAVQRTGLFVTVTGWGPVTESGTRAASGKLQVVQVSVQAPAQCRTIYGSSLTARMMCVGPMAGGQGFCGSDVGGPLKGTAGRLLGISSWSPGCARAGYPGVYVQVSNPEVWDFINSESTLDAGSA